MKDRSEQRPFLHTDNDVIPGSDRQPAPDLNQDVVNVISSHVSYKAGLGFFRQTSKLMNELVEKTPAGQLARQTHDLEPGFIRSAFCSKEFAYIYLSCHMYTAFTTTLDTSLHVISAVNTITAMHPQAIALLIGGYYIGAMIVGGVAVTNCLALRVALECLCAYRQTVKDSCETIRNIRSQLEEPCDAETIADLMRTENLPNFK